MSQQALAIAGAVAITDTLATPNTVVARDNNGGISIAQALATELKSSGNLTLKSVAKSASFTADATGTRYICDATSGIITATLPTAASCTDRVYSFKKTDNAHNVVITGAGSELIDGSNTLTMSTQYKCITIQSDGTKWQVISQY
jgi:hypothetical protein